MPELFRRQAVVARQQKLHGEVVLTQTIPIQIAVMTIASFLLIITLFFASSSFNRKESVRGFISTDKGIIKIYPNRAGNIEKLHVSEGQKVDKGEPLVSIVLPRGMGAGEELTEELSKELILQINLIDAEIESLEQIYVDKADSLRQDIVHHKNSKKALQETLEFSKSKIKLQQAQVEQYKILLNKGYVSRLEFQTYQERLLSAQQELKNIEANIANLLVQQQKVRIQLESMPEHHQITLADRKRIRSELQKRLTEIKSGFRFVINATESGTVSGLQYSKGEFVSSAKPILSIIPKNARLKAELLLPTRSAGFIKKGDEARLRFDAFPYQRFGFILANVEQIDGVVLNGIEANIPFQLNEPVYRLSADLSQSEILAYGESFPLKTGMLLQADIILERRTILDWILEPLYSMTGRLG